jgi:phenylpropionate dioxygenase-like ring-hydroxylating dioxygenase large terminal subunit
LWGKAWYPIAVLDDLNPDIIHQATLLGKDFVFWRSTPSLTAWTITDNACSHRLAPLSEGMIIETKSGKKELSCRYHGWSFDDTGACTYIPQADVVNSKNSSKARLRTYPIKAAQGMLWLWPEADVDENIVTSLPIFPEFDNCSFFAKDMPMDYEMMVENTFDPSHANILHAGNGFNFATTNAIPIANFSLIDNITIKGFTLEHSGYSKLDPEMIACRQFIAPITNRVQYQNYGEQKLNMASILHFVPMQPGYTRVIGAFKITPTETQSIIRKNGLLETLQGLMPRWLQRGWIHSISNTIDEQDLLM